MSPRKAAAKYGPDGKYYRKRLKGPDGKLVDVYGRTQAELAEKVTLTRNRLAAASDVPPQELYFCEYAASPREIRAIVDTALAPYRKSTESSTA